MISSHFIRHILGFFLKPGDSNVGEVSNPSAREFLWHPFLLHHILV